MADTSIYVSRARAAIRDVLEDQLAVVHPELEARISEAGYSGDAQNIDPHHVTTALRELGHTQKVKWVADTTRGGRSIITIQPADSRLRTTRIAAAAARKRLLFARYNGWALATKRHPQGLIGPAGESALRRAIWESAALQPASPGAGEVRELLGVRLPGPLDSAGYLVPLDDAGLPLPPVTVLFEVKNLRSWIYPSAPELYQLLYKAAVLQTAHPNQPIVPVFACRKAHKTTFWMAKQIGFLTIDMGIQYVGDVEEEELAEVRNELHFLDLARGHGPSLRIRDRLTDTLPRISHDVARDWKITSSYPSIPRLLKNLRNSTAGPDREELMADLRQANTSLGRQGGW